MEWREMVRDFSEDWKEGLSEDDIRNTEAAEVLGWLLHVAKDADGLYPEPDWLTALKGLTDEEMENLAYDIAAYSAMS